MRLALSFAVMAAATTWRQLLLDASVPEEVIARLSELGYSSKASFAFESEAVFKFFAKHALVRKGLMPDVTEDTWAFHPLVGVLRDVCAPTPVVSTPGPAASPTALALPSPGQLGVGDPSACVGHSLNVSQRDKMRRDLESKYTGLYVTESTLPSMPFLQTIQTQANQKAWEWLPWRKVRSERAHSMPAGINSALRVKKPWTNFWVAAQRKSSSKSFPLLHSGCRPCSRCVGTPTPCVARGIWGLGLCMCLASWSSMRRL